MSGQLTLPFRPSQKLKRKIDDDETGSKDPAPAAAQPTTLAFRPAPKKRKTKEAKKAQRKNPTPPPPSLAERLESSQKENMELQAEVAKLTAKLDLATRSVARHREVLQRICGVPFDY